MDPYLCICIRDNTTFARLMCVMASSWVLRCSCPSWSSVSRRQRQRGTSCLRSWGEVMGWRPVTLMTWMKCLTSQVCRLCEHTLSKPWQGACWYIHEWALLFHTDIPVSLSHIRKITVILFCCSWTLPLEKLLSKRSRAAPTQDEATCQGDPDSAHHSPAPAERRTVAELREQIEELTSQNSELALKVQVRERSKFTDSHLINEQ